MYGEKKFSSFPSSLVSFLSLFLPFCVRFHECTSNEWSPCVSTSVWKEKEKKQSSLAFFFSLVTVFSSVESIVLTSCFCLLSFSSSSSFSAGSLCCPFFFVWHPAYLGACLPAFCPIFPGFFVSFDAACFCGILAVPSQVPGVFDAETEDEIFQDLLPLAKEKNRDLSRDAIFQLFYERVACNLHVVLCMSPVGSALRNRIQLFPSLLSCCTVDFFDVWRTDSLYEVGKDFFSSVSNASDSQTSVGEPSLTGRMSGPRGRGRGQEEDEQLFEREEDDGDGEEGDVPVNEGFELLKKNRKRGGQKTAVEEESEGGAGYRSGLGPFDEQIRVHADLCVKIHQHVIQSAAEFHQKLGRPVYVTPKCFLDLISLVLQVTTHKSPSSLSFSRSLSISLSLFTSPCLALSSVRVSLSICLSISTALVCLSPSVY